MTPFQLSEFKRLAFAAKNPESHAVYDVLFKANNDYGNLVLYVSQHADTIISRLEKLEKVAEAARGITFQVACEINSLTGAHADDCSCCDLIRSLDALEERGE